MTYSWADFERVHPDCGAYWDLLWASKNEPPPENILLAIINRYTMSTSSRHDLFIFEEQELPGDLWYTPPYSASGVALYSMMTICEVISSQTYGRISLESHSNTWKHRSY